MKPSARLKSRPEHFQVNERLAFTPTGEGEHQLVRVEKRGINTTDAAARLARAAGVPSRDVGYAGQKDKHAVTCQWFSVPGSAIADGVLDEATTVLETARHARKLRPGDAQSNEFSITLAGLDQRPGELTPTFANYFGPQRFGGDNLERARQWVLERRRRRVSRYKQGLYLSVLRSDLFNKVLDARREDGSLCRTLAGDVPDAFGLPTAPLWGRGRSATSGAALEIEQRALAPYADLLEALEHAGVQQARRSMVAEAQALTLGDLQDGCLTVQFTLPAGCYATTFLANHFELVDASSAGEA